MPNWNKRISDIFDLINTTQGRCACCNQERIPTINKTETCIDCYTNCHNPPCSLDLQLLKLMESAG